jgi:hypothetical protein
MTIKQRNLLFLGAAALSLAGIILEITLTRVFHIDTIFPNCLVAISHYDRHCSNFPSSWIKNLQQMHEIALAAV